MILFLIAAGGVFLGQFVKGITGFGSALIAVPILAWAYGPREAILMGACIDTIAGWQLMTSAWRKVQVGLVLAVYLPLVGGQWVGTELLTLLPESTVRIVLGGAVALFGLEVMIRPVRTGVGELEAVPDGERGYFYSLGGLSGLLGGVMHGLVGAPGPPIVVYMRRFFRPEVFRAQLIAIFAVGATTMAPMLLWKGVGDTGTLKIAAFLLIPMAIGATLGTRLTGRLPVALFNRIVGVILVVSGLGLLLT